VSPARSSRKRYQEFVEDYKHRRLDAVAADDRAPAPAAPPGARRAYLREYLHWLRPHRVALGAVFVLALAVGPELRRLLERYARRLKAEVVWT